MKLERFPYGNPIVEVLPGKQKYPFRVKKDFVYLWPGDEDFRAFPVCVPEGYQTDFFQFRVCYVD